MELDKFLHKLSEAHGRDVHYLTMREFRCWFDAEIRRLTGIGSDARYEAFAEMVNEPVEVVWGVARVGHRPTHRMLNYLNVKNCPAMVKVEVMAEESRFYPRK